MNSLALPAALVSGDAGEKPRPGGKNYSAPGAGCEPALGRLKRRPAAKLAAPTIQSEQTASACGTAHTRVKSCIIRVNARSVCLWLLAPLSQFAQWRLGRAAFSVFT